MPVPRAGGESNQPISHATQLPDIQASLYLLESKSINEQMGRLNEKETQLMAKDKRLKTKERQIHKREEQTNRTEIEQKKQSHQNGVLKSLVT